MITAKSAAAMGTIEGENFATRRIMAVDAAATLAAGEARDLMISATSLAWQIKQQDELQQRRLELAERGADLAVMTAYERGWWIAFSATMRAATAALKATDAPKSSRQERRRAAKTGEPLQ